MKQLIQKSWKASQLALVVPIHIPLRCVACVIKSTVLLAKVHARVRGAAARADMVQAKVEWTLEEHKVKIHGNTKTIFQSPASAAQN